MRHPAILIFFIFLCWQTGFAQEKKPVQEEKQEAAKVVSFEPKKTDDIIPYNKLDKSPEFPGGINEYVELLNKKIRITDNIPSGNYRVTVSFCIEADGALTDIKIFKDRAME